MTKKTSKTRVTKGWFVEASRATFSVDAANSPPLERIRSRPFHVLAAANEYAEHLRKSGACIADSVTVRTRYGYDDAAGLCGE